MDSADGSRLPGTLGPRSASSQGNEDGLRNRWPFLKSSSPPSNSKVHSADNACSSVSPSLDVDSQLADCRSIDPLPSILQQQWSSFDELASVVDSYARGKGFIARHKVKDTTHRCRLSSSPSPRSPASSTSTHSTPLPPPPSSPLPTTHTAAATAAVVLSHDLLPPRLPPPDSAIQHPLSTALPSTFPRHFPLASITYS